MNDTAAFKDPELLTLLGTREQDVSEANWPEIRKGQKIVEDAFIRAAAAEDTALSEQCRQYATRVMLRTRSP